MNNPLISIIVPVYGVEEYLNRCVDSIVKQTYDNLEIILVDDGSPDNCPKMCDEWAEKDKRIKVIHKENGGLSSARNTGLDIATGLKICFVDSDDVINRRFVSTLLEASIEYNCSIVQCDSQRFSSEEEILEENENTVVSAIHSKDVINNMSTRDIIACNKMYDAKLFKNVKFPFGKIHEDLAITYKIFAQVETIVSIDAKLYAYYVNAKSITRSKIKTSKMDLLDIYLEQYEFFKSNEEYKIACEKAGNNLGATFGALMSHKKSDYQNYAEFKKRLTEKYIEMRPKMLAIPMRRDLKLSIRIFKRSVVALGLLHKLKTFIRRK